MNSKRGTIGQILTSFPSLIYVFVIMLIFVIISGFISKSHSEGYSLLEDFAWNYVNFNGKLMRVSDAIEMTCKKESLENELKNVLRARFIELYGGGNAFALVYEGSIGIPVLYSWYGAFEDKLNEEKPSIAIADFEKVFDSKSEKKVFCSNYLILYVKSEGGGAI